MTEAAAIFECLSESAALDFASDAKNGQLWDIPLDTTVIKVATNLNLLYIACTDDEFDDLRGACLENNVYEIMSFTPPVSFAEASQSAQFWYLTGKDSVLE